MAAILPLDSRVDKPKRLLELVRGVLCLKHYSLLTERTYCDWIERFIRFHGLRHPREMGESEVSTFLTHLARSGRAARVLRKRSPRRCS
jgi:hypothetical protein